MVTNEQHDTQIIKSMNSKGRIFDLTVPAGIIGTNPSLSDGKLLLRKKTVLLYTLEDEAEATYQTLHDMFEQLVASQGARHLQAETVSQFARATWPGSSCRSTHTRRRPA